MERFEPFTLEDLQGRATNSGHSCFLPAKCFATGVWRPVDSATRPPHFLYECATDEQRGRKKIAMFFQ
eukprot:11225461-Lingulodinium_polyedra.AAC.1